MRYFNKQFNFIFRPVANQQNLIRQDLIRLKKQIYY